MSNQDKSKYIVKLKKTGSLTNFNALNDLIGFLESKGNLRKFYSVSSNNGDTWEDAEWFYCHPPVVYKSESEKSKTSTKVKFKATSKLPEKEPNKREGEPEKKYNPSDKKNYEQNDSSQEKGKSSFGIGSLLLSAVLLWVGLTLCDIFITNIRFVENINLRIARKFDSSYNGKKLWKNGNKYIVTDLRGHRIRTIGESSTTEKSSTKRQIENIATDKDDNSNINSYNYNEKFYSDKDLILEGGTGVNIENNTKFNNIYSKLPDSEKDYYLKVITQYNPDPKGIQGKICDYGYSYCKWCNSQISYEKYYSSRVAGLQSYVSSNDLGALGTIADLYGNPTTQNIVSNAIMSTIYGDKSNNAIAESVIKELDRIRNNDIYYCVGSGPEFCSEKCKYSYNWAHGYK